MSFKKAFRRLPVWLAMVTWWVIQCSIIAQTPVVTVRFANPQNDCATQEYCLDVEVKADMPDQELFGMNVRFFYDEEMLELIDFRDYQGGYGAVAPDPPIIFTSAPAGPALFNFTGPAEFINGAIQLINTGEPPIILDTQNWSKLFQICFEVDGPIFNLDTFCPPVVWDLEQDPANGGFLSGDDGVVITIVDPDPNIESYAALENVEQFNWEYIGSGTAPYGQPVEITCSNVNCALPLALLYFKGFNEVTGNRLSWESSHETNFLGYEVQKSTDRLTWTKIGFVEPGMNSASLNAYQYLDEFTLPGDNFYRLIQWDTDGKFSFSPIINVPALKASSPVTFSVNPNPVNTGRLTIALSQNSQAGLTFRLVDVSGIPVREVKVDQTNTDLDVSGLPSGLYYAFLMSETGNLVRKVIIY